MRRGGTTTEKMGSMTVEVLKLIQNPISMKNTGNVQNVTGNKSLIGTFNYIKKETLECIRFLFF